MDEVRFTADGKLAGRGRPKLHGIPPKLPPVSAFKLNNIINDIEGSKKIRSDLKDALINSNEKYRQDLTNQVEKIRSVEEKDVLDRLKDVNTKYEGLKAALPRQIEERNKTMKRMQEDAQAINEMFADSQRRIDGIITKLKRIERTAPAGERLFDLHSHHRQSHDHLFKYAMKDELAKEKKAKEEEKRLELEMRQMNGSEDTGDMLSSSPVKMKQYLSLERDINSMQMGQSEQHTGLRNPTHLVMIEKPVTGISSEQVTAVDSKPGNWNEQFRKSVRGRK